LERSIKESALKQVKIIKVEGYQESVRLRWLMQMVFECVRWNTRDQSNIKFDIINGKQICVPIMPT